MNEASILRGIYMTKSRQKQHEMFDKIYNAVQSKGTKANFYTVKSWLYGQRTPKYLDQQIISETLEMNIDILFPES